ncbi:uncharacterized protein LOC132558269 [Ylistrum balloti]|uniref:uncharacterized protein LOC132558269 n=1 Tax=Ylistrum balloti TaxID=509963 RepID=UPI002905BD63|nr:uncharacterized protein LOC132558269 [Ylistrum balloti]
MQTIYLKWYVVGMVFFLVTFLVITIHVHMKNSIVTHKINHWKLRPLRKEDRESDLFIKSKLVEAALLINKAKIHVRGTKSADALRTVVGVMDEMLQAFDLDFVSVTQRELHEPNSVCQEIYKGTTFGYPFFDRGFEQLHCGHMVAEEKLVTIVMQHEEYRLNNLSRILEDIHNYNENLSVIVGVYTAEFNQVIRDKYPNVRFKSYDRTVSKGDIWNNLIDSVRTPYILFARDLIMFNNDTRLHRLIREIERLKLTSAGGASRDSNGHWKLGCLQRAYKNYTLVYEEGYHESLNECVFCDHIESAFVVSKTTISKISFDGSISGEGVWEDFFMRAGGESVVCPDSMFYVNRTTRSLKSLEWKDFAEKYDLKQIKLLSSDFVLDFGCSGLFSCFSGTGFAVTPCCLEEVARLVTFIMNACAETGVICELQEGTLLGAVKLQKILPWERDADITFLTANYSQFQNLKHIFGKAGYSFHDGSSLWCCVDNRTAGGKFKISSKHWHAELYGQHLMDSELLLRKSLAPTKIQFHGQWVNVPRNPGLHVRNRYGHEIYAHSQHWLATGKTSGWISYDTKSFTKCHRTGSHNCLDRYNTDGNLQFISRVP